MTGRSDISLADARREMLAKISTGTKCPCCGRVNEIRKRTITPAMAKVLALLDEAAGQDEKYWQVQELIATSGSSAKERTRLRGDFAKLRFWLLVTSPPKGHMGMPNKKWSGFWRITQLGRDFVAGRARVQRYRFIYNNTEIETEVLETLSFEEALGPMRGRAA